MTGNARKTRILLVSRDEEVSMSVRSLIEVRGDAYTLTECKNLTDAFESLNSVRPHAIIFDAGTAATEGCDKIESLIRLSDVPTIFVAEHGDFAEKAFDLGAVDFVQKHRPAQRFYAALKRAEERVIASYARSSLSKNLVRDIDSVLSRVGVKKQTLPKFVVKSAGKIMIVDASDVDFIEAAGNYVKLHINGCVHLMRGRMNVIESRVKLLEFVRIHKSTLVNFARVKTVSRDKRRYRIALQCGSELTTSKRYKHRVDDALRTINSVSPR